jgi:anti-sigma regulatory factor (Ser/Thr protein kinase)
MEIAERYVVPIAEASQIGEVRRLAVGLARDQGFDENAAGQIAIAVTEAATNVLKHGGGGEILLRVLPNGARSGVGFVALDRGRGIPNLAQAIRDGFSTAGTPGTGLGAIARQATVFDVYSASDLGTILLAAFWPQGSAPTRTLQVGAISVPLRGEIVCGDAWAVSGGNERTMVLVADGLGHGPGAAEAAAQSVATFRREATRAPAEIVTCMHEALRPTRGAAVAVAELDRRHRVIRFAGIGNVAGTILTDGETRSMVSLHGTLGHDVRRVQEFQYPWAPGAGVVLHSDGLVSHWKLDRYPGLLRRHPGVVAAVLYRDFQRGRDDTTVVVLREVA